jgi:hypothetical protein
MFHCHDFANLQPSALKQTGLWCDIQAGRGAPPLTPLEIPIEREPYITQFSAAAGSARNRMA